MEFHFIPGFIPNIQQNVHEEVKYYDPTTRESEEADDEDVVIPYADESLASQQSLRVQ